jgi:hypothetical protein
MGRPWYGDRQFEANTSAIRHVADPHSLLVRLDKDVFGAARIAIEAGTSI